MERYVKKLKTFVRIGASLNVLSTCKRLTVSAIIFPLDCSRIYSIGYNGQPSGLSNDGCTGIEGRCGCVHAEANALIKLNTEISKKCLLYSFCGPCPTCASMIINSKIITGVIFTQPYRDPTGIEMLQATGIRPLLVNDLTTTNGTLQLWKTQC